MPPPGRARPITAGRVSTVRDEGMITAEFAVALPAFVLVVVAAVFGVAAVTAQLRCTDAAATAARLAARGEGSAAVRSAVLDSAPSDATVVVTSAAGLVTATVHATIRAPGVLGFLPGFTVSGRDTVPLEPAPAEPTPLESAQAEP